MKKTIKERLIPWMGAFLILICLSIGIGVGAILDEITIEKTIGYPQQKNC